MLGTSRKFIGFLRLFALSALLFGLNQTVFSSNAEAKMLNTCTAPAHASTQSRIFSRSNCNKNTARSLAETAAVNSFHTSSQCDNGFLSCAAVCGAIGTGWYWKSSANGGYWHARNGICLSESTTFTGGRSGPSGMCSWGRRRYTARATVRGKCACSCRGPE